MFLITGCGRSGTGYISYQLNESGIVCGHENVFTAEGYIGWKNYQGDSSWYAAPYIHKIGNVPILHIVRDPQKVVHSFYRLGLFSNLSWRNFVIDPNPFYLIKRYVLKPKNIVNRYNHVINNRKIIRTNSECFKLNDEILRIWKYWLDWNLLIEEKSQNSEVKYMRVKLEEIDDNWEKIIKHLGFNVSVKPAKAKNTKNKYPDRKTPALKPPDEVIELASKYGYNY